jgi:hypothetical protein
LRLTSASERTASTARTYSVGWSYDALSRLLMARREAHYDTYADNGDRLF